MVDDEPTVVEVLRAGLEAEGHVVTTAANGEEALEVVRRERPDVVVLDLMLPGMDGWEVLLRLKTEPDPSLSGIPVIVLSGLSDVMDRVRSGIEGAVFHLTKPFVMAELVATIGSALAGPPEPTQRRRAQRSALAELARLETRAATTPGPVVPGARSARHEGAFGAQPAPVPLALSSTIQEAGLSPDQLRFLGVVAAHATVEAAARSLSVTRSNVYGRLTRLSRRLGVSNGPQLAAAVRAGALAEVLARADGPPPRS